MIDTPKLQSVKYVNEATGLSITTIFLIIESAHTPLLATNLMK